LSIGQQCYAAMMKQQAGYALLIARLGRRSATISLRSEH
jgi:hypothetical protein